MTSGSELGTGATGSGSYGATDSRSLTSGSIKPFPVSFLACSPRASSVFLTGRIESAAVTDEGTPLLPWGGEHLLVADHGPGAIGS